MEPSNIKCQCLGLSPVIETQRKEDGNGTTETLTSDGSQEILCDAAVICNNIETRMGESRKEIVAEYTTYEELFLITKIDKQRR